MSDDSSATSDPASEAEGFNIEQIEQIGKVMDQFDLSEVRLRRSTDASEQQWVLRRGAQVVAAAAAAPVVAAAPAALAPATAPAAASDAGGAEAAAPSGKTINSPTIGTFYSRPSPDDPPFVKPGDTVSADTTVCLIEAMKVYNQIPAETSGTIARMLVKDGDAVDVGMPLFELS